jgi:hypothetical protein
VLCCDVLTVNAPSTCCVVFVVVSIIDQLRLFREKVIGTLLGVRESRYEPSNPHIQCTYDHRTVSFHGIYDTVRDHQISVTITVDQRPRMTKGSQFGFDFRFDREKFTPHVTSFECLLRVLLLLLLLLLLVLVLVVLYFILPYCYCIYSYCRCYS